MNKATAVISCIFTAVLAVVGLSGYSAGTHYITWFGIRLSQGGFLILIGVFIVWDILALKKAFGADRQTQEAQSEALARAESAQPLEGAPCTVYLTRLSSVAGSAMGVRVFLNGREQEVLRNGKTVMMQTSLQQNELTLRYNAGGTVRTLSFDAQAGGSVHVILNYNRGLLTLQEGAPAIAGEADERGRYRPVKTGYILWSIVNMPIYFLGLVPLFKTLGAAKQPIEDIAQRQLHAAKVWNIVLSCLLVMVVVTVYFSVKNH